MEAMATFRVQTAGEMGGVTVLLGPWEGSEGSNILGKGRRGSSERDGRPIQKRLPVRSFVKARWLYWRHHYLDKD